MEHLTHISLISRGGASLQQATLMAVLVAKREGGRVKEVKVREVESGR